MILAILLHLMQRMKNWWDYILWKFSTCPYCGCLFRDPHFLFCSTCFLSLWHRRNPSDGFLLPSVQGLPAFPIRSLFLWVQDEDVPLSLLLKLMKKGEHPESARTLMLGFSLELLQKQVLTLRKGMGCVFIPAPAKDNQDHDHAWVLADQLAQLLPGSQVRSDLLERRQEPTEHKDGKVASCGEVGGPSNSAQKSKSRAGREKRGFRLTTQGRAFLRLNPICPIYFVDDILTTGSTAKAAWLALKKPRYFQALVLAYRKQPGIFDILRSQGKSVTTVPNFKQT